MSMEQKVEFVNERKEEQPSMLASCPVQQRFGFRWKAWVFYYTSAGVLSSDEGVGEIWALITEDEQERQLVRLVGSVLFSENLTDPNLADAARADYVEHHPEAPLLVFVINEMTQWLRELTRHGTERISSACGHSLFSISECVTRPAAKMPYHTATAAGTNNIWLCS